MAGLRIIGDEEIEEVKWGGATFRVHVKAGPWWDDLRAACIVDGRLDPETYRAKVADVIAGWDDVLEADGTPIPYSEPVRAKVYNALPEDCQDAIMEVARGRHRRYASLAGN